MLLGPSATLRVMVHISWRDVVGAIPYRNGQSGTPVPTNREGIPLPYILPLHSSLNGRRAPTTHFVRLCAFHYESIAFKCQCVPYKMGGFAKKKVAPCVRLFVFSLITVYEILRLVSLAKNIIRVFVFD